MIRLESLEQGGQGDCIQGCVYESQMNERICVQSIHCRGEKSARGLLKFVSISAIVSMGFLLYILVPKFTSRGISPPHAATFHAVCNSKIQKIAMRMSMIRVKSGSRKMYFWSLAGLN